MFQRVVFKLLLIRVVDQGCHADHLGNIPVHRIKHELCGLDLHIVLDCRRLHVHGYGRHRLRHQRDVVVGRVSFVDMNDTRSDDHSGHLVVKDAQTDVGDTGEIHIRSVARHNPAL